MDNEKIRKIIGKAKSVARKKGFQEEAEDFSQYAAIKLLNGRKTSLDNLLVDYLRERFVRTKPHYKPKKATIIPDARHTLSLNSKNIRSFDSKIDSLDFDRILRLLKDWDADKFGKLRCMVILRHYWGFNYKEIGYCFNVTDTRICQYLEFIYRYLKRKV